jgi:hypothetical protein
MFLQVLCSQRFGSITGAIITCAPQVWQVRAHPGLDGNFAKVDGWLARL